MFHMLSYQTNNHNGHQLNQNAAFVIDGHTAEDVALAMIEGRQKEPFHVFDMDEAYSRIQHFREMMPRVQIFYAMKSNDWELMLKLVASQGFGFDCSTPGEINKVLKLGVQPTSIIYTMPSKTPEQMTFAREAGVMHTTFDSFYELEKLKQHWPDANLLLRIRVDAKCQYHYKVEEKFGCEFETEAVELLDKAASLGLKVVGVAFHESSSSSSNSHAIGIHRARALFDYEAAAGRHMNIVDIGGGYMSAWTDSIDQISQQINKALEKNFPDTSVQVIAEPGRYLIDTSATLYNSICNVRRITKNGEPVNMIYLNDGLHGTLRYMNSWNSVKKLQRKTSLPYDDTDLEEAILWGPTCDTADRVMEHFNILLPRCNPHDWLVFKVQGAYSYVWHGSFSSIEIPKMRAVISLDLWTKLKDCPVFLPSDFNLNSDISTPLPSSLPPGPHKHFNQITTTHALLQA